MLYGTSGQQAKRMTLTAKRMTLQKPYDNPASYNGHWRNRRKTRIACKDVQKRDTMVQLFHDEHCKHRVRRRRYYVQVVPCTVPDGTGFHHPRANVLSEAVYISLYISRWSSS